MNAQKNIDFENARNVLNELKNYINNKKQEKNESNEMQLAEQNVIATDKIEEKPLSAIGITQPISSTEAIEPQNIESTVVVPNPVLTTEISNPIPASPTTTETVIANNPLENSEITNITSQPIQPIVSPEESIIQNPQDEPVIITAQPQLGDIQGMEAQPQNMNANSINNNDPQSFVEPLDSNMQDASLVSTPQLDTNTLNSGIAENSLNSSISNEGNELMPNGLEVVPQIDMNAVMSETSNPQAVDDTKPEEYKAATNMGAVSINDNPSITTSGEVMIPTGQESVPQLTSPVVTEAFFNEVPETIKLAA